MCVSGAELMYLTCERRKRAAVSIGKVLSMVVVLFFLLSCLPGLVSAETSEEYNAKAAFIVNFAKFSQWPQEAFPSPGAPLTLCVVRKASIKPFFDIIEGKTISGRPLDVRYLEEKEDVEGCHILFVSGEVSRSAVTELVAHVKGKAVLTIGEMKNFANDGGGINFIRKNKKLCFEINREAAKQQEVKLSSHLLKLAILVNDN